jgi:hypothetical protein
METLATHQVDRGVAVMTSVLDDLGEVSLLGLDQQGVGPSLVALTRLEARVAELKLRVLAHGAEVHVQETTGGTTAATWLASATHHTVRSARRQVNLASALQDYEVLRAAVSAGAVLVEQAEVIAPALDALPVDVPTWVRVEAEQALVDAFSTNDAQALRVLGDRILHLVAPEVGEAHEAKQLADAERRAEKATNLTLTPDGDGSVHGRFTVPELHAAILRKMLTALVVHPDAPADSSPQPDDLDDPDQPEQVEVPAESARRRRATSHEMGQALCELLERLDGRGIPDLSSGAGPTVVVTHDPRDPDGRVGGRDAGHRRPNRRPHRPTAGL